MAELNFPIDPNNLESTFEAIPAGEYLAVIQNSELIPTKTGAGLLLKLTYQILSGPQKDKKIFENVNLQNNGPNKAQVEGIAQKTMNSIGVACGIVGVLKDSAQLHGIPMTIDVVVEESEKYGKTNKIKKHIAIAANVNAPAGSVVPATTAAPVAGTAKKHPWEK